MSATHISGPLVVEGVNTYAADGAINVEDTLALISGADEELAVSLADGEAVQCITIKCIDATNNCILTPDNFRDGSTITFDAANEVAVLMFDGSNWNLVYTNATVA